MIRTPLCELLGIQYPILQGGMGPNDTTDLAVAVTNAGGLGVISQYVEEGNVCLLYTSPSPRD